MLRGMYTGASAMLAQQARVDVLANNLANVDTVGFKREQVVQSAFPDMLMRRVFDPVGPGGDIGSFHGQGGWDPRPVVGRLGTGTYVDGTWTVHGDGPLRWTDNPLDMAIVGEGFFVVETDAGQRLTRDGRFTLDGDGTLVTLTGWPVLGEDGPIQIEGSQVAVDDEGRIHVDGQAVAALQIVTVEDVQSLRKEGGGLWALTDDSGLPEPVAARVLGGYVEQSNVNAIQSMVQLISAFRSYEANQKVIQAYDATLGKAVNELGTA